MGGPSWPPYPTSSAQSRPGAAKAQRCRRAWRKTTAVTPDCAREPARYRFDPLQTDSVKQRPRSSHDDPDKQSVSSHVVAARAVLLCHDPRGCARMPGPPLKGRYPSKAQPGGRSVLRGVLGFLAFVLDFACVFLSLALY
jgi:hypothetical protein